MNPIITLLNFLQNKPIPGVITWFTGWLFGSVQLSSCINREIVLWYFQLTSLFIGSIAGLLTIIALCIKFKKQKDGK